LSAEDFEMTLQIVRAQLSKGPVTFKELVNHTNIPEEKATSIVRFLLDQNTLTIDNRQQLNLTSGITHNAQ
jgi:predicted transcriptional regulator